MGNSISSIYTIEFPPMLEGFLDNMAFIDFDLQMMIGAPCIAPSDQIQTYFVTLTTLSGMLSIPVLFFVIGACRKRGLCPKQCGGKLVKVEKKKDKMSKLKRKSMAMIQQLQKGEFKEHKRFGEKKSGLAALSEKYDGSEKKE